jgi:sugar phosphate isomerase/epimerase
MGVALRNVAGQNVGQSVWDTSLLIRSMDPHTVGYDFDAGYATEEGGVGGWVTALRLALPRLKMLSARDFTWTKEGGAWKPAPCALGEGMVDWSRLFGELAKVHFNGPISIAVDYPSKDQPAAIRRDVEFIRKQIHAAYGGA